MKKRTGKKQSANEPTDQASVKTINITKKFLRGWPLPAPDEDGDKEERGRVLVVGGAPGMPGAVMLAATAALRAGAGKLQIATLESIAQTVAVNVPESRVFALPETKAGAIAVAAAGETLKRANRVEAVLVGPGLIDENAVTRWIKKLIPRLEHPTLILDAAALAVLSRSPAILHSLGGKVIITPHAGEMASVLGIDKEEVLEKRSEIARRAANDLQAVVALKGAETFIAAPEGEVYCNRTGNVGLATSGSGDTLSGIIAGLVARGATPIQSVVWGVYLHGRAGDALAKRMG
ncbi:MAG: NAD(P)H-hydrate dehydratase, partial [Acidobacteriota bacterium]|nr:NAD(P)H-hydrate dehydratase [Acidobacteriota bacterium]